MTDHSADRATVSLTCPECGASGVVDPSRRDAVDFCPSCDFPLFWAREQVVIGEQSDAGDDSLRRLPGALGRQVIASVPCPHCSEPNLPSATVCVRCGLSMTVVEQPPPPPPPAPAPPPAPEPVVVEEEPRWTWIWWVLLVVTLLAAGVAVVISKHWY